MQQDRQVLPVDSSCGSTNSSDSYPSSKDSSFSSSSSLAGGELATFE